jgi:hypothetical protein
MYMPDMDHDAYMRQRPRSAAEELGEDVNLPTSTDRPRPGARGSTAHQMAQRRFASDAEAAREQAQAVLDAAVAKTSDERSYEEYVDLVRSHEPIPKSVWAGAYRHAQATGVPISSAERLAAQAQRGVQWQDQDHPRPRVGERGYRQDQDRRRGR